LGEFATLRVRLTTRAARDEIAGRRGDVLLVRLQSPPVDGRANAALRRLLAKRLHVPTSGVEIASGETSRLKLLHIHGIDNHELERRLADIESI
jgi:uncharacterized protein (TIGR00251 family)